MAVTYRASITNTQTSASTNINLGIPVGVQAGDLMLAFVTYQGARSITAMPAGWTIINQYYGGGGGSGNDCQLIVYKRFATGSESTASITLSNTSRSVATTVVYSGVDPLVVNIITSQTSSAGSTTITAPAASPTVPVTVLRAFSVNGAGSSVIVTPDASLTLRGSAGAAANASMVVAEEPSVLSTISAITAAVSGSGGRWVGVTVGIWPDGVRPPSSGNWSTVAIGSGPPLPAPYNANSSLLSWRPPVTSLSAAQAAGWTIVHASNANHSLTLDDNTDYFIVCDSAITSTSGLSVVGGRKVVAIGGEVDFRAAAPGRTAAQMRALWFNQQTEAVWLEGWLLRGLPAADGLSGALGDGINISGQAESKRLTTVTIQNVRAEHVRAEALTQQDETGSYTGSYILHPDVLQVYGSNTGCNLRIDKLTAQTSYQGIFVQDSPLSGMDARRVNIDGAIEKYDGVNSSSVYLMLDGSGAKPLRRTVQDFYVTLNPSKTRSQQISPDTADGRGYNDVIVGQPPNGDFVPAATVGLTYVSPGYQPIP